MARPVTFDLPGDIPAVISLGLFALGVFTAVRFMIHAYSFIHIHFVHSSKLSRYHRPGAWALVTGASQGIGKALARQLARNGFNVVLHGRNEAKLTALVNEFSNEFPNRSFTTAVADASNSHGMKAAIRRIADDMTSLPGPLTVLVNNIGAMHGIYAERSPMVTVQDASPADVDAIVNVNARFTAQLTRAVMPVLTRTGSNQTKGEGHPAEHSATDDEAPPFLILNLSSLGGYWGTPFLCVYSGTKAFIQRYSEGLSQELALQSRLAAGESLCFMVGEVTNASGHEGAATMFMPDSDSFAKSALDKVGCGRLTVAPHWSHDAARILMLDSLPEWVIVLLYKSIIRDQIQTWKERELRLAKEH